MIKIRTIIEVVGFPEIYITEAINKIVNHVKEQDYIKIINVHIEETKKLDKMYSTFTELELDFKDLQDVVNFCFDYLPSSIEILEPETINEKAINFADVLNDLMLKLHEYNIIIRNLQAENKVMKEKLATSSGNKKNS